MIASDLTSAQLERYKERAAIMEYDGGLDRDTAEAMALDDVIRDTENNKGDAHERRTL